MSSNSLEEQLKSFYENFPLYKKLAVELPQYATQIRCDRIDFWCEGCKRHLPFRSSRLGGSGAGMPIPQTESGVYRKSLQCTGCNDTTFECFYEINVEESWIRKVGQIPQWSIEIPSGIKNELKDDAVLYRKALILMSQSYGLGACVYLRRIIENQVNPLLALIAEVRRSHGSDEKVAEVESALTGKDFSSKIKLAAELLPDSVKIDGVNPIRLMYEKLSISIHGLSDDEAMDVAMALKIAFEYVIPELRRQLDSKKAFIESIRQLGNS